MNTYMQSRFDYDLDRIHLTGDMTNKLFCTFTKKEDLSEVLDHIQTRYKIIYNKIFVLYASEQGEYLCTYNVDLGNVSDFPENTILVHRKKQTNTLYTINALNQLIMQLNNGYLDKNYKIDWGDYRNSILLTKGPEFKQVRTKLFQILEV